VKPAANRFHIFQFRLPKAPFCISIMALSIRHSPSSRSDMRKVALSIACSTILAFSSLTVNTASATHPAVPATHVVVEGKGEHPAADPAKEELHLGTFVVTVVIFL